ncbi:MAG TPA: hypothetical protein VIO84_10650 [Candidatus Dormibacteraeota bacterium]|jgi:hypothetical protein
MRVYARSRAVGLALALVATTALIGLRLAAAPTSTGYRHAMDAAPGGDLYEADPGWGLVLTTVTGHSQVRGVLPAAQPLALAADGSRLVMGTDRGLYQSSDGGVHWSAAPIPQGRYQAVWAGGSLALAAAWNGRLWSTRDAGLTWEAFPTPPGEDEFQAVTVGDGVIYAATLQHVIRSFDAGRVWEVTALPARVTALEPQAQQVLAATWDGALYTIDGAGSVQRLPNLPPGVWALGNGTAATTDGLAGLHGTPLDHREVTALVSAGNALYAGVARGPVYGSPDGGHSWVQVLDG